jgi:hypothetical protein
VSEFLYVYCIGAPEVAGALAGLEGVEDGRPPAAIEGAGLVAVASEVPAADYREDALHERLADLVWAGERGLRHERVVETCYLAAPVVPLRFCTIFETRERVAALLARYAGRLRSILADLRGKAEWGLRGTVDRARFAASLAPKPAAEGVAAGGRAYLEAKKAARDAQRAAADALARALDEVVETLAGAAERAVRQPVGAGLEAGDLALRAAFLVPLAGREAFEAAVARERERRATAGIELRATGPWPPYSFVPALEPGEAEVGT